MPKHDTFMQRQNIPSKRDQKIHPIWRGVGFIFMIVIPFISYAAGMLLIDANKKAGWIPITQDMLAKPGDLIYYGDPMIYIYIVTILAIALVLLAVFTLIGSAVTSMFGQSRYGLYDLPPVSKPRGVKMRSR